MSAAAFTAAERAEFGALGWVIFGDMAEPEFGRAVGILIHVRADGELAIQRRGLDGRWRWAHTAQHASVRVATWSAADWFYQATGWELLSWRP
jgi:hypothetical protein